MTTPGEISLYGCPCETCVAMFKVIDEQEIALHVRTLERGDVNRCVCRSCLWGVLLGKLPDHELAQRRPGGMYYAGSGVTENAGGSSEPGGDR